MKKLPPSIITPNPHATEAGVEKVRAFYRKEYGVELTEPQAREVLEQAMWWAWLTSGDRIRREMDRKRVRKKPAAKVGGRPSAA